MKDLIINAPSQGIASSPHSGYGDVRNLDVFTIPGVARLNNALAKESVAVVTGLIQWMVINPATPAEIYALDNAGVVYKSANSGDTWAVLAGNSASGAGQGLAIWKNYLFVAGATKLDVCGDGSATGIIAANWTQDWTTAALTSDTSWHPMLVSKNDGKLYIGNSRYVMSVEENSGQTFAPGTPATYTLTEQALDLPSSYKVKCLAELGNNLMIGTWMGTNIYDMRVADIFPWDRSSSSFGQPVQIVENGVNSMLSVGSYLYVQAGIEGNIYKSDGVGAVKIAQIPSSVASIEGGLYLEAYPGAICNYKGRPFFGVSSGGTDTTISGMGVYSLMETSKGTVLINEHTISTGSDGNGEILKIGALLPVTRDRLLVGWRDAASYGIDRTDTAARQTGYTGYFESPLYPVGTNLKPGTYTQLEFYLAKELATNEGIKIKYRVNLTDSWTTIGTYIYAALGAITSHNTETAIPSSQYLQLRVELEGTTTTPQFQTLILR